MLKKSIIGLIAIIAAIGLVFAAYGDGNNNSSSDKSVNTEKKSSVAKNSATPSNNQISKEEAQKIAQKYIEEPGAKAGKAKLSKIDGENIYVVPVIYNGNTVGEIHISAKTGKNLGGAGGVS